MDPSLQQPIQEAVHKGLESLPLSTHSLVVGGLIAGVLLWLAGRHILRLGFVLVGMAAGALAANLALPMISTNVPAIVAIILGAALGGVLSFFAFRVAVAMWLAGIGSILATGICVVVIGVSIPEPAGAPLSPDEMLLPDVPIEGEPAPEPDRVGPPSPGETDPEQVAIERVRAFAEQLADEARAMWESIPGRDRLRLMSSALLGFAAGALLGFFAPKRAAALLTASIGSAVVMASGVWLASAGGLDLPRLPIPVWALVWIVLSAVGMKVQFMGSRRKADND